MGNKKLLIVTNVDWFLISHRLVLAKSAINSGWDVTVACEDTGRAHEISVDGIKFVNFSFSRSGTNILDEFKLFKRFRELYRRIKPDVVHHITIKPVVYGGAAAKFEKIPGVVNAISGMGYMFAQGKVGIIQKVILKLIDFGVQRENVSFIFQNEDDKEVLQKYSVLKSYNTVNLIKGSGVDLNLYKFKSLPEGSKIRILLPCRMLWDKGVKELREASELLRPIYKGKIQFVLVGMSDENNRAGVPESYLKEWAEDGYVEWHGHRADMIEFYNSCHIVVLPSYREGLPKSLIEACAIGRPIVTTNAIGCKDCVDEGVNGFKVPVKDGIALADAIEKLINNKLLMCEMGLNGRAKAEKEFDVDQVIQKHLDIYQSVLD